MTTPPEYSASIVGTGPNSGHRIEIEVDREASGGQAVFIDCDGEVMLDALGRRRLSGMCIAAAAVLGGT